jgi:hypothetical protein
VIRTGSSSGTIWLLPSFRLSNHIGEGNAHYYRLILNGQEDSNKAECARREEDGCGMFLDYDSNLARYY